MATRGTPAISDDAVRSKTGKSWSQWLAIIDRAGGIEKSHKEIVGILKKYRLGGWWEQTVTVTYEQVRGLRKRHERPSGYAVSVSRVINTGVPAAYNAWRDQEIRTRWLGARRLTVRKATKNRSLRITWVDGTTSIDVSFYRKDRKKSQVTVDHHRLPDSRTAERMMLRWSKALDELKKFLEK